MFWSTHKIIISTGHELHHPYNAHFYCYFSHRLGIRRIKTRITTLDDPNHFVDALHVYGTNEQTDQYNSTMLQKLNTSKYTIKSSDITKARIQDK